MSARIAMSGSAGTGKTTLGRRLARELGVPFIEEGMRARLEGGLDLHAMTPLELRDLIVALWDEQCEREAAAAGGYVADRSSADFAAFWIHYGYAGDLEATDAWIARMNAALARYDAVALCPWGALPLVHDGVRSTNRWLQFKYQALVEGVLARFAPPERVVRVAVTDDFEARVAQVLKHLEMLR